MNKNVLNGIETFINILGISISLYDIYNILSIILLILSVFSILFRGGYNIYKHIKNKNIDNATKELDNTIKELDNIIKKENKDEKQ